MQMHRICIQKWSSTSYNQAFSRTYHVNKLDNPCKSLKWFSFCIFFVIVDKISLTIQGNLFILLRKILPPSPTKNFSILLRKILHPNLYK